MLAFIRTWWLVNRLAAFSLQAEVHYTSPLHITNETDNDFMFRYDCSYGDHLELGCYPLQKFLEQRSKALMFGLWKRSERAQRYRMEKDRRYLKACKERGLEYITIVDLPGVEEKGGKHYPYTEFIAVTDAGFLFASPTNCLVAFCNKYKIVYFVLAGVVSILVKMVP